MYDIPEGSVDMKFVLDSGIIKVDGREVLAEELYKLGHLEVESDGRKIRLSMSKRPAKLRVSFDIVSTPVFGVCFRKKMLSEGQLNSLKTHGYFIDGTRAYFVSEHLKVCLNEAFSPLPVPRLLSLLRTLHYEQLLESIPENMIERLCDHERKSTNNSGEKLFEKALYPYQESGVNWLSFCTRHGLGTILADDMGLGKTAQIIAVICETIEREPDSRFLVVLPNPLLDNWVREFAFFAPSIVPFVHYGLNRHGLASGLVDYQVIITPYSTMTSDITLFEDLTFSLTLFDEASMLKNPSSSRSLAARRLVSDVKIAMSGTPVENSLVDAWALSDLVFEGYMGDLSTFTDSYVNNDIRDTLESNLFELEKSLRQITLRRMKKDVLEQLPSKQDIHIPITISSDERRGYDEIISAMKEDMANGGGGFLPLINRLQQYTAHPALLDSTLKTDCNSLIATSAKFELTMMQLEKIRAVGEKVLIFATFRNAIDLLKSAIKEKFKIDSGVIDGRTPNEERQPLIDCFSESNGFSVLLLHPRTAGMGFNITAATNVIHY